MKRTVFLTKIYTENIDFLYNLCRKKTGYMPEHTDMIDECIQDTFVAAVENYSILMSHPNIRGWLVRTCLNRLLPAIKQKSANQSREAFSFDDPHTYEIPDSIQIDQIFFQKACAYAIKELTILLTPEETNIYELFFVHGLTMQQIAQNSHVNTNYVKNVIKRIRRKAKKIENPYI